MKKTLVWLVISAAFIGPGTVTTATSAGVSYGTALLWTIPVAGFACIILQEGAARVTIVTGKKFGRVLVDQFKGFFSAMVIPFAIVLGCAAYEAGNILGAVEGVKMIVGLPTYVITLVLSSIAALLLLTGKFRVLTNSLGALIGIMGLGLIILLFNMDIDPAELTSLIIPRIVPGSELIVLGLIGTTVVPYNIFLGSRLAEHQSIDQMRTGLVISVIVGGVITIALMLIGSQVKGEFSFIAVADSISNLTGKYGGFIFAFGLFAAGLTSSITAPWAAATMLSSVKDWKNPERVFKITWVGVLLTGVVFGVSNVKPVPVIIIAQALNGLILPFLTFSIFRVLNLGTVMGKEKNTVALNMGLLVVMVITSILGLLNFLKAFLSATGYNGTIGKTALSVIVIISVLAAGYIGLKNTKKQ